MRDAEGLVQVQVADIPADIARTRQTDHRVHIRPVDIDLPTVIMGDLGHLGHGFLEYAVGRGIGDHATGKVLAVLLRLGAEVIQINVTIGRCLDDDHLPADHIGAGGVGAMGRHGDQADVAMPLPVGTVIGRNRQKAGIFPLRARIRLHGNRIIPRDVTKLGRQVVDHMLVTKRLILRHKRVDHRKLAPADGHHLRSRIQLHRAGPQRDHRAVQRQITVGQTAHVAHHLGLGAVHVEDRMGEIGAFT